MARPRDAGDANIEEDLPIRTPSVFGAPKYAQSLLYGTDAGSTIETMSQTLQSSKQLDPDKTESIYSYKSDRDINRFIQEYFGR